MLNIERIVLFTVFTVFMLTSCGQQKADEIDRDIPEQGENVVLDEEIGEEVIEGVNEFMKRTLSSSMAEVEMAQLALEKSESQRVKEFAQNIINEHTPLNDELKRMSRNMTIEVPITLMQVHREEVDKLRESSPEEFDPRYIQTVLNLHQQSIDNFNDIRDDVDNERLKQLIDATLPQLKAHLTTAEDLSIEVEQ